MRSLVISPACTAVTPAAPPPPLPPPPPPARWAEAAPLAYSRSGEPASVAGLSGIVEILRDGPRTHARPLARRGLPAPGVAEAVRRARRGEETSSRPAGCRVRLASFGATPRYAMASLESAAAVGLPPRSHLKRTKTPRSMWSQSIAATSPNNRRVGSGRLSRRTCASETGTTVQ